MYNFSNSSPQQDFDLMNSKWEAIKKWGFSSTSTDKEVFFDILNRAIKPVGEEAQTLEQNPSKHYSGKQTRSSKPANASKKSRGASQK
jgi:hypothetical protein